MGKEEYLNGVDNSLINYPSIDKPWLKNYSAGAEERALNIPKNKTIWDVMEEKFLEYYDIPALEYFGKEFSKQEFIDLCYIWARTFRAIGVQENEIVPIYGPFVPDVCAMLFGLNMIGACPYFLKLAISPEALAEETKEAKVAVVFDGMWLNVAHEFSKDKYKNVIVTSVSADMPSPKKQIVSFLSTIQALKNKSSIPNDKKYIWADKAREMAHYYSGDVKVPFEANRSSVITSSSGTTVGGIVKGVVATNESVLSQIYSATYSDIPYMPGDRILNHFPPTASTSLNSLFLLGLMNGTTIILDPRVSEKDFYNQLTKLKPNVSINTGSLWETFFNRVAKEMKEGRKFDFSYAKGWMIGGEGIDLKKIQNFNRIMQECNAKRVYGGYGLSETFSGICIDRIDHECHSNKNLATVGCIQAGMTAGVFDKNGRECRYNERGELLVKTPAAMKEYYGKEELTNATKLSNGYIRTGDIASIDENGFVYVYGRAKDTLNNTGIYLFDIANKIKEFDFISDAIVLSMPTEDYENSIVAHIVWNGEYSNEDKKIFIKKMNTALGEMLPNDVVMLGYAEHDVMLPYSPTTLKKDKNKMSKQTTGYIQAIGDYLLDVEFSLNDDCKYVRKCYILEDDIKGRTRTKK